MKNSVPPPADLAREALAMAEALGQHPLPDVLAAAAAELLKRLAAAHLDLEERRRVARENADGNAEGWRAEAFRLRRILGPRATMPEADQTIAATPKDHARDILCRHGPWSGSSPETRETMVHRLQQLCPELSLDRCASLLLAAARGEL